MPAKQIISVTCETVPYSKTGGLADVAGELSQALTSQGHHVLVLSPWYKGLNPDMPPPTYVGDIEVPFDGGTQRVGVGVVEYKGVTYGFIGDRGVDYGFHPQPRFADHTIHDNVAYHENNKRFALFSAAVPYVAATLKFNQPDILHVHDWHGGYLPAMMKHRRDLPAGFADKVKTVFTIHNGGYQGIADMDQALHWMGLPASMRDTSMNNFGAANALTAACGTADVVTTVSPSYAQEIRLGDKHGAESLRSLYPVKGILNGITAEQWDPANFKHPFSINDQTGKRKFKEELHEKFDLIDTKRPLMALVSRITKDQKGTDIFLHSIDRLITQGWNIVAAGNGDPELMRQLKAKAKQYKGRMGYHAGYSDTDLTRQIIAGSDAFVIPSRYEPCGITQMQSMRCGTLPIATETGGLKDTIKHDVTGFLFSEKAVAQGLDSAADALVDAAQKAYDKYGTDAWKTMQHDAMRKAETFTWEHIAGQYDALFGGITKADPAKDHRLKLLQKKREEFPNNHNATALRCYNMYPRSYTSFNEMTQAVPGIAKMGFNAVWLSPLCKVGEVAMPDWSQFDPVTGTVPPPLPESQKKGSLYAMHSPFLLNGAFANDKQDASNQEENVRAVRALTASIRSAKMAAMCDIAFSHMSLDSPLITQQKLTLPNGKVVDTTRWFKRYTEGALKGQPVMHGVDENGKVLLEKNDKSKPHVKLVWPDIAMFNYDDPDVRHDIIEHLWKPYLDYLVDLGFTGIRLDSIAQNRREVLDPLMQYFKEKVHARHPSILEKDVRILGETLGNADKLERYTQCDHLTHCYASTYWAPTVARDGLQECQNFWAEHHQHGSNWLSREMGNLDRDVVGSIMLPDGTLQQKAQRPGGAVGCPGSVDEPNIANKFVEAGYTADRAVFESEGNTLSLLDFTNHQVITPEGKVSLVNPVDFVDIRAAEAAMREAMAQGMLIAPGGHFLFSGDEELQIGGNRSVFGDHKKGVSLVDMRDYVTDINRIVRNLSPQHYGAWGTRRCIEKTDLVVIERHAKPCFDGVTDVAIVNVSAGTEIKPLSRADIEEIAGELRVAGKDKLGRLEPMGRA
ncbi:MAG: glycogen/starch synthase, partial [Rickettsiales bacterium]|nr:glycogen/starch synthase [Rickettsiales bacterium]